MSEPVMLCAIGGAVLIAWFVTDALARIFGGADELDEQTERIEQAIKDATVDLLNVLEEIRDSNAYLEESEREFNQREGHADEAPGTSLHQLMEQFTSQRDAWTAPREYGRPRGFRPYGVFVDDEPVDLTKRDTVD